MTKPKRKTAEQVRRERTLWIAGVREALAATFPTAAKKDIDRIAINASPFLVRSILALVPYPEER